MQVISHCNLNYAGSFPGMETAGGSKIFSSSKEKYGLYYVSFYGDCDNKAYLSVKIIYGPIKPIKKFECVAHYQKQVGSRLCNFKNKKKKYKRTGRKTKAH